MPVAKGQYKRPRYNIPHALLEISQPYARERRVDIRKYGQQAIRLLNYASIQEYKPADTALVARSIRRIPLPSLAGPKESPSTRPLIVQLPEEQVALMERFAERSHISVHERAARALRFMNFVAENTYPGDPIYFQQANHAPIEVIIDF